MEYIWMKSENIFEIAKITKIDETNIVTKLFDYLVENEFVSDDIEHAGEYLNEIFELHDIKPIDVVRNTLSIKTNNSGETVMKQYAVANLLHDIKMIGMPDDCPECGCDRETTEDGAWGKTWLISKCTFCDFEESNEPDWDLNRDE